MHAQPAIDDTATSAPNAVAAVADAIAEHLVPEKPAHTMEGPALHPSRTVPHDHQSAPCMRQECSCPPSDSRLPSTRIAQRRHEGAFDANFPHACTFTATVEDDSVFIQSAEAFVTSVEQQYGGHQPALGATSARSPSVIHPCAVPDMVYNHETPRSARRALTGPDQAQWRLATTAEIKGLCKNKTWEVTPYAKVNRKAKPIRARVVHTIKPNEDMTIAKWKVRVTGDGSGQIEGDTYDEVYAAGIRIDSFRVFVAKSVKLDRKILQLDFDQAYVQSGLDDEMEIWFLLPDVFYEFAKELGLTTAEIGHKGVPLRLRKSLYGLKRKYAAIILTKGKIGLPLESH